MVNSILFILHLPPPITGATMVGKHIRGSDLINKSLNTEYINLTTSTGLNLNGKGGFFKLLNFLRILFKVIRVVLRKKHDIYYLTLTASGTGFYKDLAIVAVLKMFRGKIVYHFHNKGVEAGSKGFLNKKLYRYAFKNTKSILLSPLLYRDISSFVDEKDVFYCSNGMPDVFENHSFSKEISDSQTACKLLFLSNMMKEKGVLVLLEACKILQNRKINFECDFIGAWSDVSEDFFSKKCSELGIDNRVLAHGKKYGEEKKDFFLEADIFVFPTYYHYETFGLVIVEAMQAGLPVVSTYEGGIPDVVENGKTGILVPGKNALALADALEQLISDPEKRSQMGFAGRKRYEEFFMLNIFEKRLKTILSKSI